MSDEPIQLPEMCATHMRLLVLQANYKETDPWQALVLVSQVALFQMASCDPNIHARVGGDIYRFKELGCLACLKPDAFGEVVVAAMSRDLGNIKALGESYVFRNRAAANDS
jgi:hypothetical protein